MKDAFNWDSIPVKTGATANPAAGAQIADITVPAGKRWLFIGATWSMVTDANVANRSTDVSGLPDGAAVVYYCLSSAQTAGTTHYYRFVISRLMTEVLVATSHYLGWNVSVAGIELPAGAIIRININSIQVGDDASAATYFYKEVPL